MFTPSVAIVTLCRHRLSATACQDHPWIKVKPRKLFCSTIYWDHFNLQTLNPKGLGVPSWPMAKLDLSRLKTFIARRKWHVSKLNI